MNDYAIEADKFIRAHPGLAREVVRQWQTYERAGGLTKRQQECLQFIRKHIREKGLTPSFDEMKDELGLASKSGIHRLVTSLEERGFIRRMPNRARAIELVRSA